MTNQERRLIDDIGGKATAEIAIEALRDAEENGYQNRLNPYERGTYPRLVYTNACQKWWVSQMKLVNGI